MMSRKLRVGTALLVACAAATPSALAASASSTTYYGPVGGPSGGTMTIKAKLSGGKVSKIVKISAYSVPMQCNGQGIVVAYNGTRVTVKNRKFKSVRHYSAAQGGPGTATTTGTVSKNNKTITGTTQYKGSEGPFKDCNTGKLHYKATKQ